MHLFGNSLGGAVATRVAAARPDLVRTLTLVSPALPEIRVQRQALPTALLALPGVASLFGRMTREWTAEQRTRGVMALCYGDPGRVSEEGLRHAVEEMERRQSLPYFWDAMARSARGIVDAYTLGGQQGLWRQAERVLAPTLLVYGGRDQLVSYRMARKASVAFRDSRLLTLPDAGHVAMMEYPRRSRRPRAHSSANRNPAERRVRRTGPPAVQTVRTPVATTAVTTTVTGADPGRGTTQP